MIFKDNILGIVFPKYIAYFRADYQIFPDIFEQAKLEEKLKLTILLNCRDYNLDILYYKNGES